MRLDDTIVAISSPPGAGPRGIVRLSGDRATDIATTIFLPLPLDRPATDGNARVDSDSAEWPSGPRAAAIDGVIRIDSPTLPATAWVFRRPHSYTRQDLIELHLLGAPGVLGLLVERLIAAGARRAEPGEFTARAFLNGALDLGQVHGVAAMIAAQSDGQLRAARRLLQGALSTTATAAREELADLLSLVEGALDFADEPIEFITPVELLRRLERVAVGLRTTRDAGLRAERWGRLPRVLLAGAPNAGKSSLLNRLTGIDRAIATPVAGTTRDVLTAPIALGDRECLLMDVAGLDESPDPLDRRAQSAARAAASDADVIAWLVDASDPNLDPANEIARLTALHAAAPTARGLVLLNKIDRLDDDTRHARIAAFTAASGHPVIAISAAIGAGCDTLRSALADLLAVRHDDADTAAVALLGEHHDALNRALTAVEQAVQLAGCRADSLADADLVALELHAAADALGVLVGRDVPDDLLGRVFARFCVGK